MEWMEKIIHLEPQGRWYLLRKYYSAMNPQDNIKKNFKPTYSIITERLYSFEEYLTYDGDSSLVIFVVNSMDHSSLYLVGPVFKACERAEVVIAGILIWPNGVEDSLLYENAKEYISYMKRNADFFYLCEGYGN